MFLLHAPHLIFEKRQPLYQRHVVITVDENDFRVYRRNKRETIPTLSPPHA